VIPHYLEVGGRTRQLMAVRARPANAPWVVGLVVAAAVVAAILEGRGGAQDGMLGVVMALVLLCGAAYFLQRIFRSRITAGFDTDGIFSPAGGWVLWRQVRRIEVRRMGNLVTGRRAVIWVAYQPFVDDLLVAGLTGDDLVVPAPTSGERGEAAGPAVGAGEPPGPRSEPPPDRRSEPPPGPRSEDPPADDGVRWLRINPLLSEERTLDLCLAMERQWAAVRGPRTPPPGE
jgi:hypothetical protein